MSGRSTGHGEAVLAARLLASLDPAQRAAAADEGAVPGARAWTYLPGERPGLSLETLAPEQRELVDGLVRARHSDAGAAQVHAAIARERHRRESVTGQPVDGDRFWLRLLGDPGGSAPWGWQLNGHHLAVHAWSSSSGDTLTPHFVGAEPAVVVDADGRAHAPLGREEALAHELVRSLDPRQQEVAVASPTAPDDILTRSDPVADPTVLPAGIERGDLTEPQRDLLDRLIRCYLDRAPAAYADACWADEVAAGADRIRFAWCGSTDLDGGRYSCVRATTFLIEYDNTQDDANHAHSVWRHLRDDWGDSLQRHYSGSHRP